MLDRSIISFHGFSSGVVPDAYAVNLSILINNGIINGNAITAVSEAFCCVLIAMEVISVNKKDRPIQAISPVVRNHPILIIWLPAITYRTNHNTRKMNRRRKRL